MSYTAPALVAAVKCVDCGDGPLYGNAAARLGGTPVCAHAWRGEAALSPKRLEF